ncbi:MAG: histidine phosphatase family protein [Candidatus Pacebacteria bacterium]|nr:histidine phosphatase family protein [Candidatus Paceibacterota bacterium]
MIPDATKWFFIRHGKLDIAEGVIPPPEARLVGLTIEQRTSLRDKIHALIPDYDSALWLCSTLPRSWESRLILGAPTPRQLSDFNEQDFGDWHGRSHNDIARTNPAASKDFWRDPVNGVPPGGESFAAMVQRVQQRIIFLNKQNLGYKSIIMIGHSGTIRAAVALSQGLAIPNLLSDLNRHIDHWSVTELNFAPDLD